MEASIIVDVDDTLCWNKFRDYKNAIPNKDIIAKINACYDNGFTIILYTSRGMYSHKGDVVSIEQDYRKILETWLKENNVKYHQLIFGKPLGDLYLDDKGINVKDFLKKDIGYMSFGGSNKEIVCLGNHIKKELDSVDEVRRLTQWIEIAKDNDIQCQDFISSLYNYVYLSYISGEPVKCINTPNKFLQIINIINKFKEIKTENFDVEFLVDKLKAHHLDDEFINKRIDFCINELRCNQDILRQNATFSHGDLIFSNIIDSQDGKLYLIDPRFNKEASSYLLDYANLRKSFDGYDDLLVYHTTLTTQKQKTKDEFDKILKDKGIFDIVVLLEYMFILRLYKYRKDNPEDLQIVYKMLEKVEDEMGWKIN